MPTKSHDPSILSIKKHRPVKDFQNRDNINISNENKETLILHEIPVENLESFYKYQHYNMTLRQSLEEWDILAIFPESKSIVNIEVKLGINEGGNKLNSLKKASKQTKKHFLYFQKLFSSKLTSNWNFIKAACVPYLEVKTRAEEPCNYCDIFILKEKENNLEIFTWIERLIGNNERNMDTLDIIRNTSKADYENLVSSIIGHSSLKEYTLNGLILSPLDHSKQVETAITGRNSGITGELEFNHK